MLSVEFADALRVPQIEEAIVAVEAKVRKQHPEVMGIFVKPQTEETFRKASLIRTGKTPPKRQQAVAESDLSPSSAAKCITQRPT
jgi:hypothetical protein